MGPLNAALRQSLRGMITGHFEPSGELGAGGLCPALLQEVDELAVAEWDDVAVREAGGDSRQPGFRQ